MFRRQGSFIITLSRELAIEERPLNIRNKVFSHGETNQVGVRPETEVFHDAIFVKGYRAHSDVKYLSSFFHRVTLSQELQDLPLTRCELFDSALLGSTDKFINQLLCDAGCHIGMAAQDFADSSFELCACEFLYQIARRPLTERL